MMRFLLCIVIGFILLGCSAVKIQPDITNRQAYSLFKLAANEKADLNLSFNTDSSFVLLLEKNEIPGPHPLELLVIDKTHKKKVFLSMNVYQSAVWMDNENIRLTKQMGIEPKTINPDDEHTSQIHYNYNVITNQLIELPKKSLEGKTL